MGYDKTLSPYFSLLDNGIAISSPHCYGLCQTTTLMLGYSGGQKHTNLTTTKGMPPI